MQRCSVDGCWWEYEVLAESRSQFPGKPQGTIVAWPRDVEERSKKNHEQVGHISWPLGFRYILFSSEEFVDFVGTGHNDGKELCSLPCSRRHTRRVIEMCHNLLKEGFRTSEKLQSTFPTNLTIRFVDIW